MKPGVTSSSRRTYVALGVHGRLLRTDACVGYFNNMLQLPGLLLDLSCQEQRSLGNDLYGERGERKKNTQIGAIIKYGDGLRSGGYLHFCGIS